jgi:Tol biopolymer transport system component
VKASADLGKVAYTLDGDIYSIALPDGAPQHLTNDGTDSSPRWSPSGQWLIFQRAQTYWLMRADGSGQRALGEGPAAWSPWSDRLAYAGELGAIVVEDADGSSRRELPTLVGTPRGLSWSPDGNSLAYVEEIKGTETPFGRYAKLLAISVDGGGANTDLYQSIGGIELAGWSADGDYVLFWRGMQFSASFAADGLLLQSIRASGGQPRGLLRGLIWPEMWSAAPSGDAIAMTDGGGRESWSGKRVALVDVATGYVSELTGLETASTEPSWSADGKHIAFVSQPDSGPDMGSSGGFPPLLRDRRIWVMDSNGSDKRQLTDDPAYRDEHPLWSLDGAQILFARVDEGGRASLWLVPSAGGEPRRIVEAMASRAQGIADPSAYLDYYGSVRWDSVFDWWRGP